MAVREVTLSKEWVVVAIMAQTNLTKVRSRSEVVKFFFDATSRFTTPPQHRLICSFRGVLGLLLASCFCLLQCHHC